MAFVYILQNEKNQYYIGSTDNVDERMKHHLGGYTPSTSKMGKLKLVFKQEYLTLGEARRIEFRLKKLHRHDYISKIIADGFIKIRP
jgi:putative endonuclease